MDHLYEIKKAIKLTSEQDIKLLQDQNSNDCVIGIDEAGRGAWAGPVVAGACMFVRCNSIVHSTKFEDLLKQLKDSKKLTKNTRNGIYHSLIEFEKNGILLTGIGMSRVEEIDTLGIKKANNLAMQRAIDSIIQKLNRISKPSKPPTICIDGNDHYNLLLPKDWNCRELIRGDDILKEISAASILAKVTRDSYMEEHENIIPGYGFGEHKGYGTRKHQNTLEKLGVHSFHRKSYKPIQARLQK